MCTQGPGGGAVPRATRGSPCSSAQRGTGFVSQAVGQSPAPGGLCAPSSGDSAICSGRTSVEGTGPECEGDRPQGVGTRDTDGAVGHEGSSALPDLCRTWRRQGNGPGAGLARRPGTSEASSRLTARAGSGSQCARRGGPGCSWSRARLRRLPGSCQGDGASTWQPAVSPELTAVLVHSRQQRAHGQTPAPGFHRVRLWRGPSPWGVKPGWGPSAGPPRPLPTCTWLCTGPGTPRPIHNPVCTGGCERRGPLPGPTGGDPSAPWAPTRGSAHCDSQRSGHQKPHPGRHEKPNDRPRTNSQVGGTRGARCAGTGSELPGPWAPVRRHLHALTTPEAPGPLGFHRGCVG